MFYDTLVTGFPSLLPVDTDTVTTEWLSDLTQGEHLAVEAETDLAAILQWGRQCDQWQSVPACQVFTRDRQPAINDFNNVILKQQYPDSQPVTRHTTDSQHWEPVQ